MGPSPRTPQNHVPLGPITTSKNKIKYNAKMDEELRRHLGLVECDDYPFAIFFFYTEFHSPPHLDTVRVAAPMMMYKAS